MAEKRLTWYRWERRDPFHSDKWTAWTVSVYAPTYERPFVSVLCSVANGGGRVLFRCATLADARLATGLPTEADERLEQAITKAIAVLVEIKRDLKIIADARSLQPGSHLVRTDTGEIIAEAERIIRGEQ